jgi:REP element-mobilizing transposase RayT
MINRWWEKLPGKFDRVELGDFVVMPNHFHGIIIITREEREKREKREEPRLLPYGGGTIGKSVGEDPRVLPLRLLPPRVLPDIPKIMQWFKTMSTNEFLRYQKQSHETDSPKLWQRSYYDHIIRNDADFRRISEYIRNNPEKWIADRFHR